MPSDTISVNLTHSRLDLNQVSYYTPLLVYKCAKIKLNTVSPKNKILYLNINDYEKAIGALEKEGNNGDDEFNAEKEYLKQAIQSFFAEDDKGLRAVTLAIYKDTAEAKGIKELFKRSRNSFIVFINTYASNNDGGDGLTIYKDDYVNFKDPAHFFVFATKESEVKELFKNGSNSKSKIIVIHSKGTQQLHLRFVSKYLHEASMFHAVNPYGLTFSGINPITNSEEITKLRQANINFYSHLNESGLDGFPAFKEGICLDSSPIDEIFTYDYIKYEFIAELIRIWNLNNRQNSKLSALQLSGQRDTAYSAAIACKLKEFVDAGIIVSYSKLKIQISSSAALKLFLSLSITYNYSMKGVVLNITTQDIQSYQNSLKEVE
ncbi:DUF787 family protein [Borrelia duttonii]|uniref:Uncharacterized conserved protein n=1 Tax=Borrelia duttonii (strain Ly) TaxID=412419 RepID=B5RNQ5_BORDL|nr:uncharacterized conserved protein [Borrelia duttonii Ly]